MKRLILCTVVTLLLSGCSAGGSFSLGQNNPTDIVTQTSTYAV